MNALRKKKKNDDDIATLSAVSKATSKKYLDGTGLGHLSSLIISFVRNYASPKTHNHDAVYASKSHNHDAGNITSGVLPIGRGGTGSGNRAGALYNIVNGEPVSSSTDWNSITRGYHMVGQGTAFTADKHAPVGMYTYGYMLSMDNFQIYVAHNGGIAHRQFWDNTWTNWITSFDGKSVIPIVNGGTGAQSARAAEYNIMSQTRLVDSAIIDNDYFVGFSTTPNTTNGATYKRTAASVWNYIKSKTNALYLPLTGGTISGRLNIKGNASDKPLQVRGIIGSDGNATPAELHLQYGNNNPIMLGVNAEYSISGDGGQYSGNSASANIAKSIKDVGDGRTLYLNYSADALANADWFAVWNGNALQSMHKNTVRGVIGAAPSSHTHTIANVTHLQSALDAKQPKGNYADASHQHSANDIIDVLGVGHGGTGLNLHGSGNSGIPYVYRGQPQLANLGAANNTVLMNNAGTLTFKQISASHISDLKSYLLNNIYKVGYVWISYTSTSPASIIGGTWVAITGRFPYFNAGTSTGGANSHTLSVNEMPRHNHFLSEVYMANYQGSKPEAHTTGWAHHSGKLAVTHLVGGDAAHNNMPAYQTLYAWRRTG